MCAVSVRHAHLRGEQRVVLFPIDLSAIHKSRQSLQLKRKLKYKVRTYTLSESSYLLQRVATKQDFYKASPISCSYYKLNDVPFLKIHHPSFTQ